MGIWEAFHRPQPVPVPFQYPGWNCFVATAAYGDAAHPMVQILRDFRDTYLINRPAGRWLIKEYYEHGPALADMIRNQPPAMWAARCLLAPVVVVAFCLIYAPLAIPFILLVSIILTSALFSISRPRAACYCRRIPFTGQYSGEPDYYNGDYGGAGRSHAAHVFLILHE